MLKTIVTPAAAFVAACKEHTENGTKRTPRVPTGALLFWDLRIIYVQASSTFKGSKYKEFSCGAVVARVSSALRSAPRCGKIAKRPVL